MLRWLTRSEHVASRDTTLPLSDEVLETFTLFARRNLRTAQHGAHLRRQAGQSKEFREYRTYVPGDDIRMMDWQVSARTGTRMVRVFDAEQALTIGLLIDSGHSMRASGPARKLAVAAWLAQVFARIAAFGGDRVWWPGIDRPRTGASAVAGIDDLAAAMRHGELAGTLDDVRDFDRMLHASVLVLVSDFYRPVEDELVALMDAHQRRHGILLVIELDSWPVERAALLSGPSLVTAPSGPIAVEPGASDLTTTEARIASHLEDWRDLLDRGGLVWSRWSWPADLALSETPDWFATRFLNDAQIAVAMAKPE